MAKEEKCRYCAAVYVKEHSRSYFCSWECRFKSNIPADEDPDICWDWPMSRNVKSGYGQFSIYPGVIGYAHRLSYEIFKGETDKFVMHTCDRPCCFNPGHLVAGTRLDNIQDMVDKDRNKFGVNHHMAKLDPEKIRYIRASKKTQRLLAKELGVSAGVISQVLRGLIWRRVE